MCLLKLNSKLDYFGLLYRVSSISKKNIILTGIEKKTLICEVRPSLVIKELGNKNMRVLEV